MSRMRDFIRFVVVSAAVVLTSMPKASAADVVKVAAAQHGTWKSAAAELGQQAGIFRRHDLVLEFRFTRDSSETQQLVTSGSADVGLAVNAMQVMRAYAFGAPVRIIGASMAGSADYWYVLQSSPIQTLKDLAGKSVAYERNGSSSQYDAIDFMRKLRPKVKLVETGGVAATFARLSTNRIDVGWAAPPFAIDKIEEGTIRVVARANDMPQIRNKTVEVITTNVDTLQKRKEVLVRFLQAYSETIEWMYSDPAALQRFAEISGLPEGVARRMRDEFFPKEILLPDRIVGLKEVMKDAIALDYVQKALSRKQIADLDSDRDA